MTEQPVETEQQFLGNESPADPVEVHGHPDTGDANHGVLPVAPAGVYVPDSASLPGLPLTEAQLAVLVKARQHYVPNAHLRRPSWSPVDDVELAALVRKCVNASKLLAIAKDQSLTAEVELQKKLAVEDEAATAAHDAEKALITFTRKDTGL